LLTVCHLTSVHGYEDVRILLRECRSLAAAGYATHLVAPGAPDGLVHGVRLHGVTRRTGRVARMLRTVGEVYTAAVRVDADLYHFHDAELIPVGLLLRARGRKVIYDIHEDVPRDLVTRDYLPGAAKPMLQWLVERIENFAGRRFSGLVPATPAIAARFRRLNRPLAVINNYPLLDEWGSLDGMPWTDRPFAVAYVGAVSLDRGLIQMVQAIGDLREPSQAHLELAGTFAPPEPRTLAARLEGWARVRELGQLSREDVRRVLGRVRAGLLLYHPAPNNVESQPNKLFEYMAAGLPVIASDFPLWREIVAGTGCGLLVDPLDSRAIAQAIEYVLTHAADAEAMGRRGRRAFEERFNWSMEERRFLDFYSGVLD